MKAHPTSGAACPLAAADQRLADAHKLWHQAEAAYFDPDGFRIEVQNAIQTLRSVTFILQNYKAVIPNFVEWYGDYVDDKRGKRGKWQQRMRADPLMRWMVDARNKIEKRGDLESHSIIRVEIIASYVDEGPRIDVPAHLFEGTTALLKGIPDDALGMHIRRNGIVRIQRRWFENTLPEYELLDAVAIYYGKLTELVHDAHRQMGLDPPQTVHDDTGTAFDLPSMGWRFPCMIGHEGPRALTISLADGSKVEFETKHVSIKADAKNLAEVLGRYGENAFEALRVDGKTDASLAAEYFALARTVFLRDGHHNSILLLVRDRIPIRTIEIRVENVQQKYVLMRQLADEVTKSGADAVVLIGEVWLAHADELKPYERPADSPIRTEALALQMASKSAEPLDFIARISREKEKISLGDVEKSEGKAAFLFAPFYQAWGRPVPQEWTDAGRATVDAGRTAVAGEKPRRKTHSPPPQFSLVRKGPCLCGSGLTFKRCCADRLPGTDHISTWTRAFLKAGNFKQALQACRADIAQYTIWHKSHTEPMVREGMPKKGSVFEVDVRALGEMLDTLLLCHIKTEKMEEFPAVLERLRDNIKDVTWHRKITYFHAIYALWPDWDETSGRRELKKLGSLVEDDDVDTLQLYLDLFGDTLSFTEKQTIIDRILNESKKLSDRLHYKGTRAVLYLTIGDPERADAELSDIINEVDTKHRADELSFHERYRLALALDFLGTIRRDDSLLNRAVSLYKDLLNADGLSANERAHLLGLAGDTYRHKADWESAKKSFNQALDLRPSAIYKVFLCECLLQLHQPDHAAKMLAEVNRDDLEEAEDVDYAFVLATLAIQSGGRERLENAKSVLKSVHVQDSLFRERRDAYLLNVQEAMVSGASQGLTARTLSVLANVARSATSYLILKPTIMGMGLDIGKMLDDFSKRGASRSSDSVSKSGPPDIKK